MSECDARALVVRLQTREEEVESAFGRHLKVNYRVVIRLHALKLS